MVFESIVSPDQVENMATNDPTVLQKKTGANT